MGDEKLKESIKKILEDNKLLTLSTVNSKGNPESSTAYYVFDDNFNIYFWTDSDSRHSKNIGKNNSVALNIADTNQEWGSMLRGLQVEGKCSKISASQILHSAKLYLSRYPLAKKLITNPLDFIKKYDSVMFKVEPNWIKILDEETFGKEEWKELKIK